MKDICGKDMVALAASLAIEIFEKTDFEEFCAIIEFFGILRHNLEVIKCREVIHRKDKGKPLK